MDTSTKAILWSIWATYGVQFLIALVPLVILVVGFVHMHGTIEAYQPACQSMTYYADTVECPHPDHKIGTARQEAGTDAYAIECRCRQEPSP